MRIGTLDLSVRPIVPCDIEVPLARMASSPDRVAAARWQRLLELVRLLRAVGDDTEVCAVIDCEDLCLTVQPALNEELSLAMHAALNSVWVRIWMDAPDHEGFSAWYYRIQVKRAERPLSTDARIVGPEEAARFLRQVVNESA